MTDPRTEAQGRLGALLEALADALPPMTDEETAEWDALRARRERRQAEREAARVAAPADECEAADACRMDRQCPAWTDCSEKWVDD